ncbi:MAG: restriction endonuclease subunit S [Bacteroidales bacterium]|nr:restriction endonuclease subunit S [Bacteroidales bacterium]
MEEWKSYKLSEICDLIPGFAFKSADFGDYTTKAIKIGDIQPPYVNRESMSGVNINVYDKKKLSKYLVKRGDFVLAMTGATIGKIGRYIENEPAYLNQRVLLFRPHKSVNPHFVYYSLLSPVFQKYVVNHIDSETAQPNISGRSVSGYEITLPCRKEQDRIASILSSIDEKIELNTRINHNLLDIAQSLFNEHVAKNSAGLENGALTDIATYLNGIAMQKYPVKDIEAGLHVLKIKELGQGFCDENSDKCTSAIPDQYIIKDGDIIFSWSGTLLVDYWCGGICGLNQHLFKVSSNCFPSWFIYFWTNHHLDRFKRIAQDKAVTMGHIRKTDLEQAKVFIPQEGDLRELDHLIGPLMKEFVQRRLENRKIKIVRDKLLSFLLSERLAI